MNEYLLRSNQQLQGMLYQLTGFINQSIPLFNGELPSRFNTITKH
jgi:hypothetical protein